MRIDLTLPTEEMQPDLHGPCALATPERVTLSCLPGLDARPDTLLFYTTLEAAAGLNRVVQQPISLAVETVEYLEIIAGYISKHAEESPERK